MSNLIEPENKKIVEGTHELIITLEILGHPPRKSNSRRIVKLKTGRPLLIKSETALSYEASFVQQAKIQYTGDPQGSLKEHLRLDAIIYYKNRQADLSAELIMDCLEKAGVVTNDRYITEQHLYGFTDKDNPRAILRIYKISGEKQPPF